MASCCNADPRYFRFRSGRRRYSRILSSPLTQKSRTFRTGAERNPQGIAARGPIYMVAPIGVVEIHLRAKLPPM